MDVDMEVDMEIDMEVDVDVDMEVDMEMELDVEVDMGDREARQLFVQSRADLVKEFPYLANLVYSLSPVFSNKLPTYGVTKGGTLFINPQFQKGLTRQERVFVVIHEALHVFLQHIDRMPQSWDFKRANMAADLTINPMVEEMLGSKTPAGGLHPSQFGLPVGQSTAFYYDKLPNQQAQGQQQNPCSSGELSREEAAGEGQDSAATDKTEVELQGIIETTAAQIEAHQASHPGTVPAGLEIKIQRPKKSKRDWKRYLHEVRAQWGKPSSDTSYSKFNRRSTPNVILPGRFKTSSRVEVWVDTSGSMMGPQIEACYAELLAIMSRCKNVDFYCVDTTAYPGGKISDPRQLKFKGGGGTCFQTVFEDMAKRRPDRVIFMTDAYASGIPERPPWAFKSFVWALVPGSTDPAKWGTQLKIGDHVDGE